MSAQTHISNGGRAWEHDALAERFREVPLQDEAYVVAPSFHEPIGASPQNVIDALQQNRVGEPVEVWKPINR